MTQPAFLQPGALPLGHTLVRPNTTFSPRRPAKTSTAISTTSRATTRASAGNGSPKSNGAANAAADAVAAAATDVGMKNWKVTSSFVDWGLGTAEDSAAVSSDDRPDDSWSVYGKPGNMCVVCVGRGKSRCMYCFGKGTVKVGPEAGRDDIVCPMCNGSGWEECFRCHGTGIRPATRIDFETGEIVPNLTNEQVSQLPSQAEVEAERGWVDQDPATEEVPKEEEKRAVA